MTAPQMALCLRAAEAAKSVGRVMVAASSGLRLTAGIDLGAVLGTVSPPSLQLLVVDAEFVPPGAIDALVSVCPNVQVVVVTDTIDEVQLASAIRIPRLLGFVGRTEGSARTWEIAYLVRRLVAPHEPVPGTHQLLSWGASSMTFQPRTTRDRDLVVRAIDMVAFRFGASERDAAITAAASLELLNNAMFEAPVDDDGQRRYDPDRKVALLDREIPTLRLTVDSCHIALDISDPFGRMERNTLFGRLLYPAEAAGITKLYRSGAILRVEVVPGRQTMISWVLDRGAAPRSETRSLYFLEGR